MQSVVGLFTSRTAAEHVVRGLLEIGIQPQDISFLTRESAAVESVPTTDAEAPGMGKTLGAYVGGVIGASAGLALGSAVASLAVPGVGMVFAAGVGAAAALVWAEPLLAPLPGKPLKNISTKVSPATTYCCIAIC